YTPRSSRVYISTSRITISWMCANSGRCSTFLSTELRKLYDPPPGIVDVYSSASRSGLGKSPTLFTYSGAEKSGNIIGLFTSDPPATRSRSDRDEVDIRGILHRPVAEPAANPIRDRVLGIEAEVRLLEPALEQPAAELGDRRRRIAPLAKLGRRIQNAYRGGIPRLAQHAEHAARSAVVPEVELTDRAKLHADAAVERGDAALGRERRAPFACHRRIGRRRRA